MMVNVRKEQLEGMVDVGGLERNYKNGGKWAGGGRGGDGGERGLSGTKVIMGKMITTRLKTFSLDLLLFPLYMNL